MGCEYHGSQRSSTTYWSQALGARQCCMHGHATTGLCMMILQPAPAAWELCVGPGDNSTALGGAFSPGSGSWHQCVVPLPPC